MNSTLTLLALRTIKHSDSSSILSAYSREAGRVAFAVPAGSSREAVRRRALLMPMSLVECTAAIKPGREILTMSNVMPLTPHLGIHAHPVKATVAMFMAEVLGHLLREGQPDEPLFAFLQETVERLDRCPASRIANFHIAFLRRLARYLGVEPDFATYEPGMVFDLVNGVFTRSVPTHGHYLIGTEAEAAGKLGRMDYDNMHFYRFSREQRNRVTDVMLAYYSQHLAPLSSLQTLPVLRSL